MAVKIITVPFNAQTGMFEEEALQDFLLNKKNVELKSEFFQVNGNAYWTVYVEYEEVFEKAKQVGSPTSARSYVYSSRWEQTCPTPIFVPSGIKSDSVYLCSLTCCFRMFVTSFSRWRCLKGGRSPTGKHLHREALTLISLHIYTLYFYCYD
ncbi:MAG: hypothetical protein ACOC10_10950 [Bacteroidota bacterium]